MKQRVSRVLLVLFVLLVPVPLVAQVAVAVHTAQRDPASHENAVPGDAVAQSAAVAGVIDVQSLDRVRPDIRELMEEGESDLPLSDVSPETFRELKRRFIAPGPPAIHPEGFFARQDSAVTPEAPPSLASFAGVSNLDQTDGFIYKPPDVNIAAGPNHVVMAINSLIAIYTKSGTLLSTTSSASWFTNVCSGCRAFDPRIAYDATASRWIMIYLYRDTVSVSRVLLAVSQSSDPTGTWWVWNLDGSLTVSAENTWADYPDVGFDGITSANGGAVYVTTNQFTFAADSFRTAVVFILPKSSLYSGSSISYWRAYNRTNADTTQAFTLRAAKTYGNPGGEFLVNSENNGSTLSLWRINPTYPPAAVDWTLQSTISIGSYSIPPDAAQPATTNLIQTLDNRLYNAVWHNNRLCTAFTTGYNWGSGTVAAIRALQLNTSTNTADVNEIFGLDATHYYSPAIASDSSDNLVYVFSRSSSGEYAGARYTGRLTTDTGSQGSAQLKAGTMTLMPQSGTSSRWGDYQGAVVDPSDTSKVWIAGQWATNIGYSYDYNWSTWIGEVQFSVAAPPAPAATAATNVTTSGFSANWNSSSGATGYRLDVSTSNTFGTFISGFQDLDAGNVQTYPVSGLDANTQYYFRVRAYSAGTSGNSNTIGAATSSSSGLIIKATFDSSIIGSGNSAAVIAMIDQAVAMYQTTFSDPVTASILFRYATTDPGGSPLSAGTIAQSNYVIYTQPWSTVINALTADAKSANDATANASLPGSALTTSIIIPSADGRAIGLSTAGAMAANGTVGTGGTFDGIVTLNSSQPLQFTRPVSGSNFDALRATQHEMDEVLGFGSYISKFANVMPQDLFSWSSAGTRNIGSSGSRYFSINSGATNIVGFNQNGGGDYGDWLSGTCPQSTPYVQNAFSCTGQSSDISATSPEGVNLDVIGYDLAGAGAVNPPTNVVATASATTSVGISWSAPGGTTPAKYHVYRSSNHTTYTQVNGESTTGTSYTDSSASANTAYLYKVRSVNGSGSESSDSNIDLATTVVFTDATLVVQSTRIKAVHLTQLRTAVDAVRVLAGLGGYGYSDPTITALSTPVRRAHIIDLRAALDAARSNLSLSALSYTDAITAQSTQVKAVHFTQLRDGVK